MNIMRVAILFVFILYTASAAEGICEHVAMSSTICVPRKYLGPGAMQILHDFAHLMEDHGMRVGMGVSPLEDPDAAADGLVRALDDGRPRMPMFVCWIDTGRRRAAVRADNAHFYLAKERIDAVRNIIFSEFGTRTPLEIVRDITAITADILVAHTHPHTGGDDTRNSEHFACAGATCTSRHAAPSPVVAAALENLARESASAASPLSVVLVEREAYSVRSIAVNECKRIAASRPGSVLVSDLERPDLAVLSEAPRCWPVPLGEASMPAVVASVHRIYFGFSDMCAPEKPDRELIVFGVFIVLAACFFARMFFSSARALAIIVAVSVGAFTILQRFLPAAASA